MKRYFISDLHFGHESIIEWERTNFNSIEEHDQFLISKLQKWAKQLNAEDELYILGDWGDTKYLHIMYVFNCKTIFVYGNHDKQEDFDKFAEAFDEVHLYPFFITKRVIVSHHPVAVYDDTINVHGHTHSSYLCDPNHICASIAVRDYKPVTYTEVAGKLGKLPKYSRRFLWEPWAQDTIFTQERNDVVCDQNGLIDVGASRALQKLRELDKK